jgi:hypothetical protein
LATTQTISPRQPTWLFSSGPIVGDPPPPNEPAAVQGHAGREAGRDDPRARAQAVQRASSTRADLNWCEKVAVRCAHANDGDHRDRAAVDEWAGTIARELEQG